MEERAAKSDDGVALPLLVAPGLDAFRHGFTTRAGGVSRAPFDSLNLGGKWGDRPDDVYENYRRLLAVAGVRRMYRVSQVHGVRVVRVGRGDALDEMAATPADGLCTDEPGLGVAVHVADCTPILLACPRTGAVAALHAGWRGTAAGMAKAGVATMVTHFGCHPHELRAALGPCIGACCCEVGPEVVAAFVAADAQARDNGSVVSGPAKEHIDSAAGAGARADCDGACPGPHRRQPGLHALRPPRSLLLVPGGWGQDRPGGRVRGGREPWVGERPPSSPAIREPGKGSQT